MAETITQNQKIISYLTFCLGEEHFALNVGRVVNILEMQSITKVPKAPEYIPGFINLRGEVLPLIDTNMKLGLGVTQVENNTCILVIEAAFSDSQVRFGIIVDSVQEVIEIRDDQLLPSPSIGDNYKSDLLSNVVELEGKFIMIIDIQRLLDYNDVLDIRNINIRKIKEDK